MVMLKSYLLAKPYHIRIELDKNLNNNRRNHVSVELDFN